MFVDASAMVAIIASEPEGAALSAALEGADAPVTSAIAVFEAVSGICRKLGASSAKVRRDVSDFLEATGIRVVPLAAKECEAALDAWARYGKGRGHPAQLNMGDCFAYGVAKSRGVALLFKGDDFTRTDIARA